MGPHFRPLPMRSEGGSASSNRERALKRQQVGDGLVGGRRPARRAWRPPARTTGGGGSWARARRAPAMLGHAVAHVALEAVAGMRETEPRHQPVARDLGDDGGRRDRQDQRVARDHRRAFAAAIDLLVAVDEDELRPDRQRLDRARQAPTARRAGYCRGRCARSSRRPPPLPPWRRSSRRAFRALRRRASWNRSGRAGCAWDRAPRPPPPRDRQAVPCPASSQPATGQMPLLSARRSRRKLGRRGCSFSGKRPDDFRAGAMRD